MHGVLWQLFLQHVEYLLAGGQCSVDAIEVVLVAGIDRDRDGQEVAVLAGLNRNVSGGDIVDMWADDL